MTGLNGAMPAGANDEQRKRLAASDLSLQSHIWGWLMTDGSAPKMTLEELRKLAGQIRQLFQAELMAHYGHGLLDGAEAIVAERAEQDRLKKLAEAEDGDIMEGGKQ